MPDIGTRQSVGHLTERCQRSQAENPSDEKDELVTQGDDSVRTSHFIVTVSSVGSHFTERYPAHITTIKLHYR
jgi:hypothetical protein